ncbi:MAG: hypothetical protein ACFFEF_00490 [Candidatus Thorarchaeota archaeon]
MTKLIDALDRISTPRNLVIGVILAIIVVSLMGTLTQTLVYSVYGNANMPDTNFGYTFAQIQEAFETLGSEGLQAWLQVHLLDLIFPLTYAFSMTFGILMELRGTFPEKDSLRALGLLPIAAAFADYVENTLIASQAVAYPSLSPLIIGIASYVTIFKWLLLYAGFGVVFLLLLVFVAMKLKQRSS